MDATGKVFPSLSLSFSLSAVFRRSLLPSCPRHNIWERRCPAGKGRAGFPPPGWPVTLSASPCCRRRHGDVPRCNAHNCRQRRLCVLAQSDNQKAKCREAKSSRRGKHATKKLYFWNVEHVFITFLSGSMFLPSMDFVFLSFIPEIISKLSSSYSSGSGSSDFWPRCHLADEEMKRTSQPPIKGPLRLNNRASPQPEWQTSCSKICLVVFPLLLFLPNVLLINPLGRTRERTREENPTTFQLAQPHVCKRLSHQKGNGASWRKSNLLLWITVGERRFTRLLPLGAAGSAGLTRAGSTAAAPPSSAGSQSERAVECLTWQNKTQGV